MPKYPTVATTEIAIAAALAPEKQDWFETKVLSRLTADERTGCLNWTGAVSPGGYGSVSVTYMKGRYTQVLVHRLMWARSHALPAAKYGHRRGDMVLFHTCHNRRCANVDHMRLAPHHLIVNRSKLGRVAAGQE